MKKHQLASEKQQLATRIKEKYKGYLNSQSQLASSRVRDRVRKQKKKPEDYFNKMIFTDDWMKFKTFFGHKKLDVDPEENISTITSLIRDLYYNFALVTSPVYNVLYDKSGRYIITGGNDG